jgi:ubiquinone/menaquinone biosynthesis C-methylase UbiE
MSANVHTSRFSLLFAWAVLGLFIAGNFLSIIGSWTGPILGVWFVSTQKPRRGFLWLLAFGFIPNLLFGWRGFSLTGPVAALNDLGLLLLTTVLGILPLTFHRLVLALTQSLHLGAQHPVNFLTFVISWLAAILVWLWNRESPSTKLFFGGLVVFGLSVDALRLNGFAFAVSWPASPIFAWICLDAALLLGLWALFHPLKDQPWAERAEALARLQSPFTSSKLQLQLAGEQTQQALVSLSGERFPIRNGIPAFVQADDLTGDNGKYNHLYETIGGFYNDIQRVYTPLKGVDLREYFLSYMRLLEVKPGDSVLETSVGTGLNFKYLPHGVKLSGLDLSPEMLANCQANLRRWRLQADLYLGNAENLPFADNSFDVVFHVGGINFFNDRAKAIREMIRVACPGSLLLIADETEEHVKSVYEKHPGGLYRNRPAPVAAPIDLVPAAMQQVHLEVLRDGMFYALTFRKPPAVGPAAHGPV